MCVDEFFNFFIIYRSELRVNGRKFEATSSAVVLTYPTGWIRLMVGTSIQIINQEGQIRKDGTILALLPKKDLPWNE